MVRWGIAVLFMAWAAVASAQEGPARVIDGDTLDVAGERVRLHGIDAPEKDQTCTIDGRAWECGIAAWGRLVQILAGQIVRCERRDVDHNYSIEQVPWVQYFEGAYGLHAAFWHDRYGEKRSRGCVNLSARDARWLFGFTQPALPAGWYAILPTEKQPGTLVVVR